MAVVKLLLETGKADVEWKDKNDRTPLSWAIEGGHEAVVEQLLKAGAKANCEYSISVSKLAVSLVYAFVELIANPGVFGCYSV